MHINWFFVYVIIASILSPILFLWKDSCEMKQGIDLALLMGLFIFGIFALPFLVVVFSASYLQEIKVYWPLKK